LLAVSRRADPAPDPDGPDETVARTVLARAPGGGPATSVSVAPPPEVVAGRYEILGLLGVGGMGRVYRARDLELGELVALKVLQAGSLEGTDAVERFRREVRLARHVTHRNVVRLFDIGEDAGVYFLTMELVEGLSLATLLARSGALSVGRVLDIAADVCAGLAAAHEAGVVHRDLKPGNVLLAEDGRVVLTDFGIATSAAESARAGLTGDLAIGTPDYMAPEQVEARADVDARADIFALGVVLYEMLVGERPWMGGSPMAVALARLLTPASDPVERRSDVPPALSAAILRCLARSPEDRFASVAEVARALAGVTRRPGDEAAANARSPRPADAPVFGAPLPGHRTVAVLPFRNAGTQEEAYVADGLTEDLADTLSMTPGLRVRAYGIVREAAAAGGDPREVGRALGVQVVVEGSVRRIATGVRIAARVVGVSDGFQLWAGRFDRPAEDLLVISDEVARAIAGALSTEVAAPERRAPPDPEAVDLYLRGRQGYRNRFSHSAIVTAVDELARAVALVPDEPSFLSAYAMALVRLGWFEADPARRDRAIQMSERAIALAPYRAEPHLALAIVRVNAGEPAAAVREIVEALRCNPAMPEAHELLGEWLAEAGATDRGLSHLESALALDPTNEGACAWIARVHFLLGDRDKALAWVRRVRAAPFVAAANLSLGRFALADRDPEAARAMLATMPAADGPAVFGRALLERVATGHFAEDVREFLERLVRPNGERRQRALGHQIRAELAALDGDDARVLAEVEGAVEAHLFDILWMDRCPGLAGVRGTAAFAVLRARVAAEAARVIDAAGYSRVRSSVPPASA